MRKLIAASLFAVAALAACVTINVYFPAAEVNEAAQQFVEDVISGKASETNTAVKPDSPNPESTPAKNPGATLLDLLIPSAHAQADITVQTPQVRAIQARMKERFDRSLAGYLNSGAIGLGNDGYVVVRDAASVPLPQRAALNQAVADENRDRKAVYSEIASANGNAAWEDRIRTSFGKQWVQQAKSGWYYQDDAGAWQKK
ncbi:MAG: YdbL family protein [Dokdonella sp.]